MANLHNLFQEFNKAISITGSKKTNLITSKDAIRSRIRDYFKEKHPEYIPKFWIQGSYKMGTAIRTKDDICDLDDGVYFEKKPNVTPTTLQEWVKYAVSGHTSTSPQHLKKCIRNIFVNDYEIDIPVYWEVEKNKKYKLAVKGSDWEGNESDCKELVDWFNSKKDASGVLVRIVKFLKAWCDYKRNKMPSGLAMSILAANAKDKIVYGERDDISLRDTLKEMKKALNKFECKVPATPHDNLFEDYDETRKNNFLKALDDFIDDAEKAIKERNQLKSSNLWKKHLGDRFPLGENIDDEEDSEKYSGLYEKAKSNKPFSY